MLRLAVRSIDTSCCVYVAGLQLQQGYCKVDELTVSRRSVEVVAGGGRGAVSVVADRVRSSTAQGKSFVCARVLRDRFNGKDVTGQGSVPSIRMPYARYKPAYPI